ncbi:MAG: hypothetical protein K2L72_01075, partial [Clostridia bacterium]|nr:hypothetical protein [Clostridia bacterium]
MAEKDTKPKTTAKTSATEKPAAAKSSTAKTASTTKPSATAKPAASVKPASETKTATAKTAKPAASVKPASEAKTTAAKPAASSAKPAATAKPAAKKTAGGGIAGSAANKPTAAANAPEGSGIAGSAANKPTAAANAPEGSGIAGSAAKTEAKTKSNDKPAKKKKENSSAVAVLKSKKTIAIISSAVAFILILAIIIGIVVGTKSCNKEPGFSNNSAPSVMPADKVANDNPTIAESTSSRPLVAPVTSVEGEEYDFEYTATSAVGFSSKIIDDNYPRYKPVADIKDERDQFPLGDDVEDAIAAAGSVRYPKYGYTMSSVLKSDAAREALINESDYLTAYGTRNNSGNGQNGEGTYNMMDKDGYLYFVNNGTTTQATNPDGSPRRLYKHSAAEGMYYGGINDANPELADDEPGIVKEVTLRPRGYGSYSVTGVYAPAGEVIKIEMSEADMNATGGITIHIGQALYNGQSNNIWVAKGQMQRFPNILNTMVVNKNTATLENGVYTAYVGSFIGGPLYIRNTNATFTATISGGVRYSHFILGYTTKEEYEENKKSSTPYFDLEVWNYGVLHSGPKYYAQDFSYDDLYKVAVLWEKVSSVTTTGSSQG